MFIKTLKITSHNTIIREIKFQKGINLIVDNTPEFKGNLELELKTGNNVGKTTVLKLIDYCFGADAKGIYADIEGGKQTYDVVKKFLIDNEVIITLVLKESFDFTNSKEVVIERNFLLRNKTIRTINGMNYKKNEFSDKLRELLYPNLSDGKPSLRQIISHNIRYTDNSINNTLKTLDTFTSDAEYETLYLYLLGCKVSGGEEKQKILSQIKQEKAYKDRLEKSQTKNAYEVALAIVNREIDELNDQKTLFNINENYKGDLLRLTQIRYDITKTSEEISNYEIRRSIILETKEEIGSEISNIDRKQLRQIYTKANKYLDRIQKTFEDLEEYHNKMIIEKVNFILRDLPELKMENCK